MTYYDAIQTKQKLKQLNDIIRELEAEKQKAEKNFIQVLGLGVDDLADIEDDNEFDRLIEDFFPNRK